MWLHQALVELVDVAALRQDSGRRRPKAAAPVPASKPSISRQPRVEIARERELLRLGGAESGNAGDLQRQPEPQRAEMARQLGRQVGGRRADLGLAERPDIFAAGAERLLQQPAVADDDRAGAVRQEQGLVRIERDAVGLLDPAQQRLALVAQREKPAISAVDVKPRAVAAAKLGDFGQRIDRAGVDRSGRGDDQPGANTVAAVFLQRLLERLGRHAIVLVGRDHPLRRAAAAGDVQRLVDAIMGEARDIDRASAVGIARLARGDDRGQIGDASARSQRSGGIVRKADDAGEPGGAGILDPHRAGAGRTRSPNICSRSAASRSPNAE